MLQEAGLVNLFRTILVIVVIYYGFKFIARYLFPYLLKKFINKQQNNFYNNRYNEQERTAQNFKEGEVRIKSKPIHQDKDEKLGEYIDFVEISDEKQTNDEN